MFDNIGTVAAGVAWELAQVPPPVRERQLARLHRENAVFYGFVVEHLGVLQV